MIKIVLEKKEFWKSKSFWAGVGTTVGGIITAISGHILAGGTLTVVGVVNIILRFITTQEIK